MISSKVVKQRASNLMEPLRGIGPGHTRARRWAICWLVVCLGWGSTADAAPRALDVARTHLTEGSPPERLAAASTLGRLGEPGDVERLIQALDDPAYWGGEASARALGVLARRWEAAKAPVQAAVHALEASPDPSAQRAALALVARASQDLQGSLDEVLAALWRPELRSAALLVLSEAEANPAAGWVWEAERSRVVDELRSQLEEVGVPVEERRRIVRALGVWGTLDVVPVLIDVARHAEHEVEAQDVAAVLQRLTRQPLESPDSWARYWQTVHPAWAHRHAHMAALGQWPADPGALAAARRALEALQWLRLPEVTEALTGFVRHSFDLPSDPLPASSETLLVDAIECLAALDDPSATLVLVELLIQTRSKRIRRVVTWALGALGRTRGTRDPAEWLALIGRVRNTPALAIAGAGSPGVWTALPSQRPPRPANTTARGAWLSWRAPARSLLERKARSVPETGSTPRHWSWWLVRGVAGALGFVVVVVVGRSPRRVALSLAAEWQAAKRGVRARVRRWVLDPAELRTSKELRQAVAQSFASQPGASRSTSRWVQRLDRLLDARLAGVEPDLKGTEESIRDVIDQLRLDAYQDAHSVHTTHSLVHVSFRPAPDDVTFQAGEPTPRALGGEETTTQTHSDTTTFTLGG